MSSFFYVQGWTVCRSTQEQARSDEQDNRNFTMYKFVITINLVDGARDKILEAAPAAQQATRNEAGCLSYDFFTCTDNPNLLVFIESWIDEAAHQFHMEQEHTKSFIAFHEQFHKSLQFEVICND